MDQGLNQETNTTIQSSSVSTDPKTTVITDSINQSDPKNTINLETGQAEINASTEDGTQNNQGEVTAENQQAVNYDFEMDSDEEEEYYMDKPHLLDYYQDYKDCTCCKGHVYNCEGDICQEIGECFCFGLGPAQEPI